MIRAFVIVTVIVGWTQPVVARAQTVLTLAAALAQADAGNPEIAAARGGVDAARAQLAQAAPTPLQVDAAQGITQDTPGGLGTLQTFSVGASQELSPAQGAQRRAATSAVDVAQAQFAATRRDVFQRVVTAYYALASAAAVVSAAQQGVHNANTLENGAALRARVGEVGSFEVLRTQVELRRVQSDLLRAQATQRTAEIALNVLLGRTPETQTEVTLGAPPSASGDVAALYAKAASIDPGIAQFRAAIDQALAQQRAARLQRVPSLGLAGGYLFQRAPGAGGIFSRGPTAELSLSMPLLDYGTISGAVHEARAKEAIAQAELRGRDAQLRADIERNVVEIESDRARADFAAQSLDMARRALALAQFGYDHGALGVLDVLSARNQFAAAQSELTQASAELAASVARLKLTVGEPIAP